MMRPHRTNVPDTASRVRATPFRPAVLGPLLACIACLGIQAACTSSAPRQAAEPQPAEDAPAPGVESFDQLEQEYGPRLNELYRRLETSDPDARIADARRTAEDERRELESLAPQISELEQQISASARALAEIRRQLPPEGSEGREAALREARAEENRLVELGDRREAAITRREELEKSLAARAQGDDPDLDDGGMKDLYRQTVELQREYYRDGIDLARRKLAGQEASFLTDHFAQRMQQREQALADDALSEDLVQTFVRQRESDTRMEAALYLAYVLEVRFPSARHELELISAEEREDLELLAEALANGWDQWGGLRIHIDGYADSRSFRDVSACVSATKNLDLSRRRATAVRDFLAERLGARSRFVVDWFGNFALQAEAGPDEADNRRIELRIASEEQQASGVHSGYFDLRRRVEIAGREFVREPGRWVEARCQDVPPIHRVEHLSPEYRDLVQRLGLDLDTPSAVELGGGTLLLTVGNHAVLFDGASADAEGAEADGTCVEVVPCTSG